MINEACQNNDLAAKIYSGLAKTSSMSLEELLRVNDAQRRLNSSIDNRLIVLDLALKASNPQENPFVHKSLILQRFRLSSTNDRFSIAMDDWNEIISWQSIPQEESVYELKSLYSNLIENEADRLVAKGQYNDAVNLIRPIAINSLIDDSEVLSSSLVKLIEWENINTPALELIPNNAEWSYLDDGSDPTTEDSAWREPWFPEIGWKKGKAKLGYGDDGEITQITQGEIEGVKYITYYFRHKFNVAEGSKRPVLVADIVRDDGAIVYLNGIEIHRSNMPGR